MSPTESRPTGRRSAVRRSLSPTGVLAVLLPLLTVGALALVQPDPPGAPAPVAAREVPVTVADLGCPAGLGGDPVLAAAPAGDNAAGSATVDTGSGRGRQLRLGADAVTRVPRIADSALVRARGALSAELLASRFQTRGLAATECPLPRPEYWFTGAGADADHASVLELANPDAGPAVADVTVLGRNGPLDAPELRGLIVQGGRTMRIDLADTVPTTSDLALQVVVSRGRLAATVADGVPALGSRRAVRDWLPASGEPATEQLLLGLVRGTGRDTLTVANPGEDEARVQVRIVTEDAAFVPEGLEEFAVPPGAVETVPMSAQLREQVRRGALGVRVTSTGPVTASLASTVGGDLSYAPVVAPVRAPMTALVPPGRAAVALASAERTGVAVVAAYDDGRLLDERRLELNEGSGGLVSLPRGTSLVRVTPQRTGVAASVVTTASGASVVPMRELVRRALVPDVRPGLP